MDPSLLSHVTFPDGFDPDFQYFAPDIYRRADSAVYPCVKRFDSENPFDRRCSIVATNVIVRVLNRDVVPSSLRLKGVAEQIDYYNGTIIPYPTISGEFEKIQAMKSPAILPSLSFYRTTRDNAPQLELIHITVNVFRTFYTEEVNNFKRILSELKKSEEHQEKKIFGVCPGSIVDAVAERTRGNLKRMGLDWEKTLPLPDPASASEECLVQ